MRHIEISLADTGLTYQPGDALGVFFDNDPALVDAVLAGRAREVLTIARVRLANRVAGAILMLGGVWLAFVNKA